MPEQRAGADTTNMVERLQQWLEGFVARGETPAAAAAVAVHGEQVAELYVGRARPEAPAGPDTLWPLASISKLYTAAAVMALVERGEATLSAPISTWLPRFTGGGKERVCLWHLLTHTAGVLYEAPEMAELLARETPLDTIVDEVYERPLLFAPGTRHSYSDLGFALAGRVAATVAGTSFEELVREHVLEPAGLMQTRMPPRVDELARVAHVVGSLAYGTSGAMYNTPYALGLAHPAFGTVASLRDLLRFGLCYTSRGPRLLSAATVRAMTTNQLGPWVSAWDADGVETPSWGLGFMLRSQYGPARFSGDLLPAGAFGHGGASGCALSINPVDDVVIAFVSNQHASTDREGFARRIASVLNLVTAGR